MALPRKLSDLLRRSTSDEDDGPFPERLTYVVGDIHGRADLLERLLRLIEQDRAGADADLVFLGDYVDRGPSSADVLHRLRALSLPGVSLTCLMGNHERMMLDFLADPGAAGERWLINGGLETAQSFLDTAQIAGGGDAFARELRDALQAAIPPALQEWIAARPLQWRSGTLGCVHAVTDPLADWDAQAEATLLWGRPDARMPARRDGLWIAIGHTVVASPVIQHRRIMLDTGAYRSGVLSAARIADGTIGVIST